MQPDLVWENLDETPFHPEYPCGHCLSAAAAREGHQVCMARGMVRQADPTSAMMLRRFDSPKEYVDNVALSRIYIGVHYRFSVDAGVAMGTKVGELTAQRFFLPLAPAGQ